MRLSLGRIDVSPEEDPQPGVGVDEPVNEIEGAATAMSSPTDAAEAGRPVDAVGCSTESVDAAHGETMAGPIEPSVADAADDPASSPGGDAAASAARLASSPLAPLLLLAVRLAAWEATPASDRTTVFALRERLVAVVRDLVHLPARGVPQPLDHVVELACEGTIEDPEEATCAPLFSDEGDRLPADGPGEEDAGVGAAPAIDLTEALDLHELVVAPGAAGSRSR